MRVLWVNPNPTLYIASKDLPPVMSWHTPLGKEFSLATHIYLCLEWNMNRESCLKNR